ncbi:MAG: 3-deoxy-D-manno-octulosonic acid transferase [Odoribacteraceae bacterium]|jgi:3-deoxy-D-manno-octulosonic-acid transferase|nr:3-deoxy-D-manno-octulosonic acid transferase [Odoribacteraceae bacterium]
MNTPVALYTIAVAAYHAAIRAIAPFHRGARAWVKGRRGQWKKINAITRDDRPLVWFHVASLGEFEQGRPLVEMLRERQPRARVLLTFFSPSGYEPRKNYPGADAVFYLPPESPRNAKRFLQAVRPDVAVFVKYEFWYHYLRALHRAGVPTYLLSAAFRPSQPFFRPWGALHRRMLRYFTAILVQDNHSARLLRDIGLRDVSVTGDTRFDRVIAIANAPLAVAPVDRFRDDAPLIVCGSTWPADEKLIATVAARHPSLRWLIAPHQIAPHRLRALRALLGPAAALLSDSSADLPSCRFLVVDRLGLLSSLYRHATIAYIGGGFGRGIHNTLEAAVYGLPVLFGPAYQRFGEAVEMTRLGCAFPVRDARQLDRKITELLSSPTLLARVSQQSALFVQQHSGATLRAFDVIFQDPAVARP